MCVCFQSFQSCPTLCNLMDCSLPGFFVTGILQARIVEWVAILSSGGSCQPGIESVSPAVSCITGGFFTTELLGKPYLNYIRSLSTLSRAKEVDDDTTSLPPFSLFLFSLELLVNFPPFSNKIILPILGLLDLSQSQMGYQKKKGNLRIFILKETFVNTCFSSSAISPFCRLTTATGTLRLVILLWG